jgi:Kae1-associated kinase Bud32
MKQTVIAQGAEAILIQTSPQILLKKRTKKSYRYPALDDKIRKTRTKKESKLLEKASKLIPTPIIIKTDFENKEIEMAFLPGKKLSEHLDTLKNNIEICETIGKQIALLHDNEIIHGDLTTSNMILSSKDNKLYFIDYGLGYSSNKTEDKAVDLHLIKQALEAKHFLNFKKFFSAVLKGYKTSPNSKPVLQRLKKVELRGRYKQQF